MTTARFGLAAGLGLIVVLAAAPGLGAQQRLSPPDSSELELAGRQIKVTFSSPSVRDRVIFGGLVPWNQVWRTGANEATSFSTEANLRIGDAEVPAGEYTLYTINTTRTWTSLASRWRSRSWRSRSRASGSCSIRGARTRGRSSWSGPTRERRCLSRFFASRAPVGPRALGARADLPQARSCSRSG